MSINLSYFIEICLRSEIDKSIFSTKKKRYLVDFIIVLSIVVSSFLIVGYFFDLLESIHYLFYMFFIGINTSYGVGLYLSVKANVIREKLNVSIFHAIFMRLMVMMNLTSLLGLMLSFLFYQPYLGIIEQIILLLISITSSVFLLLRASRSSVKHHDIQDNLIKIIFLIPIYLFLIYIFPAEKPIWLFLIPTLFTLVVFFTKHNFIPKISIGARLHMPIAVLTTFVFSASLFFGFYRSNVLKAEDDDLFGLYYYHLNEEKVCETGINAFSMEMMINKNFYFLQTGAKIYVYNTECSLVEELYIEWPYTMFELEGDVAVLSHLQTSETLLDDYQAYTLYIFDGQSFNQERIVYQYGQRPRDLFIYQDKLSYAVDHDYQVINGLYIPYIQSYDDDSNYGIDIRIDQDVIHYQDDHRLIFQSNGLNAQSRPIYNMSSFLYSNGYILKFSDVYQDYSSGDVDLIKVIINPVEDEINERQDQQIIINKTDLGISSNYVEGFHYLNQRFYIYVNESMYVFNHKGKLIEEIKRIPVDYQFVDDDLYILSSLNEGTIHKVQVDNAGMLMPRKHVFTSAIRFVNEDISDSPYIYNFHLYPIYVNYMFVFYFASMILIYKNDKKTM